MTFRQGYYPLRTDDEAGRLLHRVRKRFPHRVKPTTVYVRTYYDTFDWRLYKDGGLLTITRSGRQGTLRWTDRDGRLRHRLRRATMPPFAADFPDGPLRNALRPIVDVRRLLPIVRLTCEAEGVQILDSRAKTIATLLHEHGTIGASDAAEDQPLPAALRLAPLRGYADAAETLRQFLAEELGLKEETSDELVRLLAPLGRTPGDYTAKLDLKLNPEMATGDAVRQIHQRLLAVLVANEGGIRADLDTEFLHDFRVACRRARSALAQLKGALPPAVVAHHRAELAWLGSITGPMRDLDVYLEKMKGYRASLPEAVRADLAPLEEHLGERRRVEHRRLVEQFASLRYRELIDSWGRALAAPRATHPLPENAARPVAALSEERIWQAYRRVLRNGRKIGPHSPDSALHRLRIDCKKLRYLMEFFRSLYDAPLIERLIDQLKQLQDNLGEFNDLSVQQETLRRLAREMREGEGVPVETYLAMGRLQTLLEEHHAAEREQFAEVFTRFAADEQRRLFQRVFKPEPEGPR